MTKYKNVKSNEIMLSGISPNSLVNGPGLRMVYFSQGCTHKCNKCFNPETWNFSGGKIFKIETLINDLKKEPYLDGITFSGGDPIEQYDKFNIIAKEAKSMNLSVWLWTGYTWKLLMEKAKKDNNLLEFIKLLDVVVDGKFVASLTKTNKCKYTGSSNQKLIDVKKTLHSKKIVEWIF
ncbi:MAG: anaerobic ribonucleoside-triphosphate reductase activating protein [Mycoplasmoidaceae bacterium]|nr:MAG: anaerobic ribonucleoside-triphosphate reductase activating protein [Mycoplasmoidaceae bacterium]